jgi:alpha-N-arabinofuranosidase
MILTPTYHVFHMFRPFQDATFLPTDLRAAGVSVSAARTATGEIAISLVNMDPHEVMPVSLSLAGAKVKTVKGEILTAAAMDAHNTFGNPDAVKPIRFNGARLEATRLTVSLPAKSVVVLSLQ